MAKETQFEICEGRETVSVESAAVAQCIDEEAERAWNDLDFVIGVANHPYGYRDDGETLEAVEAWRSATAMRALIKGDRNMVEMIWGEPETMRSEVANY